MQPIHFVVSGDSGPVCGVALSGAVTTTTITSYWFTATNKCRDCLAYIADAACHRADNVNMHLIVEPADGPEEWRTLCGLIVPRAAVTVYLSRWLAAPSRCPECIIAMEKLR